MNRVFAAIALIFCLLALLTQGCASLDTPIADRIIKQGLGRSSLKIGMTKAAVESAWGKPDESRMVENKEKWSGRREMWVYRARASAIPLDVDYLSETKRLYFDGDFLTNIEG